MQQSNKPEEERASTTSIGEEQRTLQDMLNRQDMKWDNASTFILAIVIALISGIICIKAGINTWYLESNGIRTKGEIVDISWQKSENPHLIANISFASKSHFSVRYKPENGMPLIFNEETDSINFSNLGDENFQVGSSVDVLYRADNPQDAIIDFGSRNWNVPCVWLAVFLVSALIAWLRRQWFLSLRDRWLLKLGQ